MSATAEEALATLKSIDASIKALLAHFGVGPKSAQSASTNVAYIADDADLSSKYGDEKIKFMPRDWSGDSYVGRTMSECPVALLDMLAASFDFFAQKNAGVLTDKGQPKSFYDQRSASRARGWAARIRAGYVPPAPEPGALDNDPLTSDSIPF